MIHIEHLQELLTALSVESTRMILEPGLRFVVKDGHGSTTHVVAQPIASIALESALVRHLDIEENDGKPQRYAVEISAQGRRVLKGMECGSFRLINQYQESA